ncbi:MAG: AAA family ATPase [Bacteroidales bacterium]|nr:AAA family ATPase [Bacteroidales bacterium]
MKKMNLMCTDLKVRPADATSIISHEFPGYQHFDDRTDFPLLGKTEWVDVTFTLSAPDGWGDDGGLIKLKVELVKLDDPSQALAWEQLTVRVNPWDGAIRPRVDLWPKRGTLSVGAYSVLIKYGPKGKEELLNMTELNFLTPMTPNRVAHPVQAWLRDKEEPTLEYKSVIYDDREYEVIFLLDPLPSTPKTLPEMWMQFTNAHGERWCQRCRLLSVYEDDKETLKQIEVHCTIDSAKDITGPIYAELQIFGYGVAGIVFGTDDIEYGVFADEGIERIRDYIPAIGCVMVEERLKKMEETSREFDQLLDKFLQEQPQSRLDRMVGLDEVKSKVKNYMALMHFFKLRREQCLPTVIPPLHSMFLGSPGTGKTTVAKIMGEELRKAGVLSKGHVVVTERSQLLGIYYGSPAEKVTKALEEAEGGILFIDEAYQLYVESDPKDPGRDVINYLLTALADTERRDWMLIMAGYTEPMLKMFDANPGLRSRIPSSNIYRFEDYGPDELMEIAQNYFSANSYILADDAQVALSQLLDHDYEHRDKEFGNARHVMNIIETQIIPNMANRIATMASPSANDLSMVLEADIPAPTLSAAKPMRQPMGFRA